MGIKVLKRKNSEGDKDEPKSKKCPPISNENGEPSSKTLNGITTEEFVKALPGSQAAQAVKEWLYMISGDREKYRMNRELFGNQEKQSTKKEESDEQSDDEGITKTKTKGDKGEEMDVDEPKEKEDEEEDEEDEQEDEQEGETEDAVKIECAEHIDNFIASGGTVKDLIGTLPAAELVVRVGEIKYIFRTLFKVLVRISVSHRNKIDETVEACEQLLSSYSKFIFDMLQRQREPYICLDVLTAMATLSPKLALKIINTIKLDADIVKNLTSLRAKLSYRIAYTKFLIAILIDGDPSLLWAVSHQPWLFTCLMEGLRFDPAQTVAMYLMTVKKAFVENPSILKTTKLTIFTPDVIISLLHLYKWKGPENRPKTKSLAFWAMKKIADKPKMENEIDSDDADIVSSAVHELLLVLLTSHRFGIIFGDSQKSPANNTLVSNVLQRVGHPWLNPKVADLISKALAACPDALQPTLASMEPLIQPRSAPQWFNCAKFLCQVLDDQKPEDILLHQPSMPMYKLATASMNMCIPLSILRPLSAKDATVFCNSDIAVAKSSVNLFVSMLRKAVSFRNTVCQWAFQKTISYAQSTTFHSKVNKFVNEVVPSLGSIQKAWQVWSSKLSESDSMDEDNETGAKPIEILFLLLEALEMYYRLCPAILHPLRSAQSDFKESLTAVVLQDLDSEDMALLRNRVFQLLLTIKDEKFVIENNEQKKSISVIFHDLSSSSPTVSDMAFAVLQKLINKSIEVTPHETILWLSNFQHTFSGKEKCPGAITMLIESLTRASASCPKYFDIIASAEDEASKIMDTHCSTTPVLSDGRTLQELFDDLSENKDVQQPCKDHLSTAKLSPLLPAFLEVLRENLKENKLKRRQRQVVEDFSCKVILRLLCRFPHSGAFLQLVLHNYPDVIPPKLCDYLQSWLPGGTPQAVELNLLGKDSAEVILGNFLFCENEDASFQDTIKKLFISLALPTMDDNPEESEDRRLRATFDIIQLVHFISFHLTQLAQLEKLTESCAHKSQQMLLFISDTATHFDQFEKRKSKAGLFSDCFKVILSHPFLYQQFNPLVKGRTNSSTLLTNFMTNLLKKASMCPDLEDHIEPYKRKMLENLQLIAVKGTIPKQDITELVDSFQLKFNEISAILVLISGLPSDKLVRKGKFSQWLQLADHLIRCASELRNKGSSDIKEVMILPPSVIMQISNWIFDYLPNENIDVSSLIESFMSYIKSCPQQTSHINNQLLSCVLANTKCSVAVDDFVKWMASFMSVKDLQDTLIASVTDKKKSLEERLPLLLPLVRVIGKEGEKMPIFGDIYTCLKVRIKDWLLNVSTHPPWLAMNADVVVFLMKRYIKKVEREQLCKEFGEKVPSLKAKDLYYLQLVTEVLHTHQPQLLRLLLAWLGVALKKSSDASEQAVFAKPLCEAIGKLVQNETEEDFTPVVKSNVWQETLRLVLKYALVAKDKEQNDLACVLLQMLVLVFEKMYSPQEGHEHVPIVYSMITQHSGFINLMLSHNPCKFELIQLLHVLLERNPKMMESSQAPILISAYNASLSKSDRALLKMLMMYERCGVDLSPYRPFYWGRQGADYYALWSQAKSRSLDKQLKPDQILDLLKTDMVMNTVSNFPLHSTFKITDAETEYMGTVQVYDPSFYLPLFIGLLSPESLIIAHQFMRTGGLAITLAALSSFDDAVRAAAYTVLTRFLSHLEMARGFNKDIAMQFITCIQKGLLDFDGENTQLSSIVTIFLAKASLEIADPWAPLNKPLINFILAKPFINLKVIPEFLELMHSDHVNYLTNRHWILEVVKDGIKDHSDVGICMDSAMFKMILSFYSSCISDAKSKLYILQCVESSVDVQYGACRLVRDYSLSSWLHQTILSTSVEDTTLIETLVRIVSKLWGSLLLPCKAEIPRVANPASTTFHLLVALLAKVEAPVSLETLCLYVNTLNSVVSKLGAQDSSRFTKDLLVSIIEIMSSRYFNKRQFFDLMELGCNFIDIDDCNHSNSALENSLRRLTCQWIKHRTPNEEAPLL